jgi:hypothetical protein
MTRTLHDDTLIVFLSDTHIGGDQSHDIFESPAEIAVRGVETTEHRCDRRSFLRTSRIGSAAPCTCLRAVL